MGEASKTTERRCGDCRKTLGGRSHRRYCNPTCRYRAWRRRKGIGDAACTYCGALADTVDHVPARSVRPYLREHDPGRYPELEVRCCRECNSALGARGFRLSDRRELARRAIEKRYAAVLRAPHWTPEELEELGPTLAADVQQHQHLKAWVLQRLCWNRG